VGDTLVLLRFKSGNKVEDQCNLFSIFNLILQIFTLVANKVVYQCVLYSIFNLILQFFTIVERKQMHPPFFNLIPLITQIRLKIWGIHFRYSGLNRGIRLKINLFYIQSSTLFFNSSTLVEIK